MTTTELAADMMARNLGMVKSTLADFSDADLMTRPAPAANHVAWQLGHLIASESRLVAMVGGGSAELPPGFAEKFTKETLASDDPAAFPTKAELFDVFDKVREASIRWAKGLAPADLDRPTPERIHPIAPTVGHLAVMIPMHTTMHLGQFQVVRRKLGKPVLF